MPVSIRRFPFLGRGGACVDNGSHNVSRWMTWLPISLKNAVKCDKWYQLQNHSITESLNANGAWEKLYCVIPVHAIFSVSNKKQHAASSLLYMYIYIHYIYMCLWKPRGGVCLCCAHIYDIYIVLCAHVDKLELDKYTHVHSPLCGCARGKTPLWCLQSSLFLFLFLSLFPPFSPLFFHQKEGSEAGGGGEGGRGDI